MSNVINLISVSIKFVLNLLEACQIISNVSYVNDFLYSCVCNSELSCICVGVYIFPRFGDFVVYLYISIYVSEPSTKNEPSIF